MVASCSLCGEQYGVTEDVTFHKFPANEERRKKWLAALQRGAWSPGKRSMLCSNHFPRDKFVHKISGDKIRRYLMADSVPTIIDRTKGNLKIGESQQLAACSKATDSHSNASTNATAMELEVVPNPSTENSSGSLNLEILAATSVALESYSIPGNPGLNKPEENTVDEVSERIETSFPSIIAVAGSSANNSHSKAENLENKGLNNPTLTNTFQCKVQNPTEFTTIPKRNRQVYPGDFKQFQYNNDMQVSKSWTALNNSMKKMRSNMKVLRQRNRRLEKRVTDLKEVIKFLKNRIVVRDSVAVRMSGSSDSPVTRKAVSKGNRFHRISNHLTDHDYFSLKNKSTI